MQSDQEWPITADRIWLSVTGAAGATPRPALFLDRDGVIVDEVGYLLRAEDVRLLPGAAALIGRANRAGVPVAVVTNQSGIARGMFGWAEFSAVEERLGYLLAGQGAVLDAVAACPFHRDFTPGFGEDHANWRKPGSAMLSAIGERLNLDLGRSWLVGDKAIDVEAARNAGLAGAVHVRSGHGAAQRDAALAIANPGFIVLDAESASEAELRLMDRMPKLQN